MLFSDILSHGEEIDKLFESYDEIIYDVMLTEGVREVSSGIKKAAKQLYDNLKEFIKNMMDFINKFVKGHLDNLQIHIKEDSEGNVYLFYYNNLEKLVKKQLIEDDTTYEYIQLQTVLKLIEDNTVSLVKLYNVKVTETDNEKENVSAKDQSADAKVGTDSKPPSASAAAKEDTKKNLKEVKVNLPNT